MISFRRKTLTKQVLSIRFALILFALIVPGPLRASVTPVVRPDPRGSTLEPAPNGPALTSFNAALAYLKQAPQAFRIISWLQRSAVNYRVEIVDRSRRDISAAPTEFEGVHNLIRWDPELALEWHGKFYSPHAHSPAIGLMHELGHAYHKDLDPEQFFRLLARATPRDRWSNLEEKRTILQIENPIAEALGESQRFFHKNSAFFDAQPYAAIDSTSIRPAAQPRLFTAVSGASPQVDYHRLTASLRRGVKSSK